MTHKAWGTAQKVKFFMKGFFSRCDQSRSFLRICPHLLKKSLKENFICCAEKGIKGMQFSSLNNCSITNYTAFFIINLKFMADGWVLRRLHCIRPEVVIHFFFVSIHTCPKFFGWYLKIILTISWRYFPFSSPVGTINTTKRLALFLQFELSKHYLLFRSSHPEVFCKKRYS